MNIGFDIDGVIDAFPEQCQAMISAFTAAAHHVYIITGVEADTVADRDVENKQNYLLHLGIPPSQYYRLVVLPRPHDANKARVIQQEDIALLFDNDKKNVKAASKYCAAFLLWNTKK